MPIIVNDPGSTTGLVTLADAKDYLNIPLGETAYDRKLQRYMAAVQPLIEGITGPIVPTTFDEWHDGGQHFIRLRRRPSTAYGTTPILTLLGVDEYRGLIRYPLSIIADPARGSIYTCSLDPRTGEVVRRTAGGGVTAFPAMPKSVHVVYQAGQQTVPANVYEGALELLRVNYQMSQQVGRGRLTGDDAQDTGPPLGFYMPRRVRELLAPNRRHPAIA